MKASKRVKAISHEELQVAINYYIASGGIIHKLPDQLTPIKPSVGAESCYEDLADLLQHLS